MSTPSALEGSTSPVVTARWLLIAVHTGFVFVPATITSFGVPGGPATGSPWMAYPIAAAILVLQLRHSLAYVRGVQPRYSVLSFIALTALVYLPLTQFGWNWVAIQACVMASGLMLLPGWWRLVAVLGPMIGLEVGSVASGFSIWGAWSGSSLYFVFYWTEAVFFIFVALYASARLPRLINDLQETRAELAELAVEQERLRISRDLHDLFGHSLSAVSLKGDLAIRLLRRNPKQALSEIQSLTELARESQRGIRAVSRNEHTVSLRSEGAAAAALLSAAGVDAEVDLELTDLAGPLERTLAWAVREGVANALQHSRAQHCSIRATRHNGSVLLEIVNDGVVTPAREGSGLTGITERAHALSGSATYRSADGLFRLQVQVPEAAG